MKELQAIAAAWQGMDPAGGPAALATVVQVAGSAYRQPGARLLILPDGRTVGGVSCGCLEADVLEKARRVLAAGAPRLATYDTGDEDEVFGLGLGCRGRVDILIEPLGLPGRPDPLVFLAGLLGRRQAGVCATVFRVEGTPPAHPGDRLLLSEDGQEEAIGLAGGPLLQRVRRDARAVLRHRRPVTRRYAPAGSRVEVFFEPILPPLPLLIFGAGHDVPSLVRLAREMGWHISVVDARPAYASPARFPEADVVLACRPEQAGDQIALDERTRVVLMTHNLRQDRCLLEWLLRSPVPYLGVLGSRLRTARLLEGLPADLWAGRLHSPVGLDIGAETPEQIALAIVAEIQAAASGRAGRRGAAPDPRLLPPAGPLRDDVPGCPLSLR